MNIPKPLPADFVHVGRLIEKDLLINLFCQTVEHFSGEASVGRGRPRTGWVVRPVVQASVSSFRGKGIIVHYEIQGAAVRLSGNFAGDGGVRISEPRFEIPRESKIAHARRAEGKAERAPAIDYFSI